MKKKREEPVVFSVDLSKLDPDKTYSFTFHKKPYWGYWELYIDGILTSKHLKK